ncbi:MAG: KH domain-containing protein, partial [Symploca sp. SIO3C6]|nr:KH domain-containing protein [Symploca sp. SIO3C6]
MDIPSIDYAEVVRFLVGPFLDSPESLRVSCETSQRNGRVLIRLAIEGEDKGKVFGRGGRNIQAVRTALQSVSRAAHQKVHLEVYGSEMDRGKGDRSSGNSLGTSSGSSGRRSSPSRPSRRPPR